MRFLTILTLGLCGLALTACKEEHSPPTKLPGALMIGGAPVDPLCFDALGGEPTQTIALTDCGKGLKVLKRSDDGPKQFVSFQYEGDDLGGMSTPYIEYEYLGSAQNAGLILVRWSGGGTGHFSTLGLFKRDDKVLTVKDVLAGGDRCNGGVDSASIDAKGHILYKLNITPYDMLALGGDPQRPFMSQVSAYDDLDACAACCYGTAGYVDNELTTISVSPDALETLKSRGANDYAEGSKQQCFDEALLRNTQSGILDYSAEDWETLMREVEHVCLGRVEGE